MACSKYFSNAIPANWGSFISFSLEMQQKYPLEEVWSDMITTWERLILERIAASQGQNQDDLEENGLNSLLNHLRDKCGSTPDHLSYSDLDEDPYEDELDPNMKGNSDSFNSKEALQSGPMSNMRAGVTETKMKGRIWSRALDALGRRRLRGHDIEQPMLRPEE